MPRGKSDILDVFKEVGITILFADSIMMVSIILFASYLATFSQNFIIILFIISLYLLPYMLYSIKK